MPEPSWRALLHEAATRLAESGNEHADVDARRIVEEASGWEGVDHSLHLDDRATTVAYASWRSMLDRRLTGEPLQYVLGRWGFRTLDLHVDRRVLIPRPETEVVAGFAIAELQALRRPAVAVDLGTGSGAIALSIAAECWPHVEVLATDAAPDALELARANLAGLGRRGTMVRMAGGDWFDAVPQELRGGVDVVVSNPPYVAEDDPLPAEVADWEPTSALVAGPTGLEAIGVVVGEAPRWLCPTGVLVVEIGETQGDAVLALAAAAGFPRAEIRPDFAGRPRALIARQ